MGTVIYLRAKGLRTSGSFQPWNEWVRIDQEKELITNDEIGIGNETHNRFIEPVFFWFRQINILK